MPDSYVIESNQPNTKKSRTKYAKLHYDANGGYQGFSFIDNASKATRCTRAEAERVLAIIQKKRPHREHETNYYMRRVE